MLYLHSYIGVSALGGNRENTELQMYYYQFNYAFTCSVAQYISILVW